MPGFTPTLVAVEFYRNVAGTNAGSTQKLQARPSHPYLTSTVAHGFYEMPALMEATPDPTTGYGYLLLEATDDSGLVETPSWQVALAGTIVTTRVTIPKAGVGSRTKTVGGTTYPAAWITDLPAFIVGGGGGSVTLADYFTKTETSAAVATRSPLLTATAAKTSAYTAAASEHVQANAAGGAFTVTIPSLAAGSQVAVKKTDTSANVVTVALPDGTTVPLRLAGETRTWQSTGGTGTVTVHGLNRLDQLDARYPVTDQTGAAVGSLSALRKGSGGAYTLEDISGLLGGAALPTSGPLAAISKIAAGTFKAMMVGTSKQTFDRSPVQVFCEHLKTLFGDSGAYQARIGSLGSLAAYQGWQSQRYGGPFQYRLVGTSTSTVFTLPFYGDQVTLEFSRETDSVACNILIDGAVVGQTPGPGAQAYSQAQTFTVAAGAHTVSVAVPSGAGGVYWEYMVGGLGARKGVEVRDATLGGSTLGGMVSVAAADAGMTASIPIVGDNGINAVFNRPDIDLFVMGYLVNDAGSQSGAQTYYDTVWKPTMDKIAAVTAANGSKLVLIVEMAGHYAMPNDGGSTARNAQYNRMAAYLRTLGRTWNHITVVDQHAATIMSDLQAYATRYFPLAGTLNLTNGTYTGSDFIHEDPATGGPAGQIGTDLLCKAAGITPARRQLATLVASDRTRTLSSTKAGQDRKITVGGTVKRVPMAAGAALLARAPGSSSAYQGDQVPFHRDAGAANIASAAQAAIDASGTVDPVYGPYLTMSGYNISLPSTVDWAGGARRLLSVRGRGTVVVRASGVSKLHPGPGMAAMAVTDAANDRTQVRYVLSGDEPAVFSVQVGATATGGIIALFGDVFEVSLVDADAPVLAKDAPVSAGAGSAFGAPLVSGRWSPATVFGSITTATLTLSRLYAVPMLVRNDGALNNVGVSIATAVAGALVRPGLYADGGEGRPTTLLGDSGQVDASTTGFKPGAAFTAVPVKAGQIVWLAFCAQGTAAAIVRAINGSTPLTTFDDADYNAFGSLRMTHDASAALPASWFAGYLYDGPIAVIRAKAA